MRFGGQLRRVGRASWEGQEKIRIRLLRAEKSRARDPTPWRSLLSLPSSRVGKSRKILLTHSSQRERILLLSIFLSPSLALPLLSPALFLFLT